MCKDLIMFDMDILFGDMIGEMGFYLCFIEIVFVGCLFYVEGG